MKKKLLSLSIALMLGMDVAMAVPARPGKIRIQQPNGTYLTIELRGDEYSHTAYTEDGYPLTLDSQGKQYEYASVCDGKLVASGIMATDIDCRTEAANNYLKNFDKNSLIIYNKVQHEQAETMRAKQKAKAVKKRSLGDTRLRISNVPTTGSPKALVVLVEFLDTKFSEYVGDAKSFYTDLLNKPNYSNEYGASGSAFDFYKASSNGLYTPEFDVYGPVTVSQQESFYAGTSGQANVALMVYEVVKKIDKEVDFSQYDTDGDGEVDNMYIFYAGKGQADTGTSGLIWPHNAWVSLSGYNIEKDGVVIDRYACSSELNGKKGTPLGVGTFVHEFGHVLGIPDLYDTEAQFTSGYTVGKWDTMCNGSYNNEQNTPPLYSSYERYALGWIEPTVLDPSETKKETLNPLADENKAFLVPVPQKDSEYFLLENRQHKGWDEYLPGHGMIVWHIDENKDAWMKNAVNNALSNPAGHKCIDIMKADGMATRDTEDGDAFPGTGNINHGSFLSWANKKIFNMTDISEDGDLLAFTVGDGSTGISSISVNDAKEGPVYSLDGTRIADNAKNLPKGIYINGGKKIVVR